MSTLAQVLIRGLRSAQPLATDVAEGTLYFVTDEGVTEQSDGTTWLSYSGAGGAISAINFSAGTTSNNLSRLVFSNSNGVSFGLNGSTITGSHNGLTSQSNQAFSAQGGSSTFQTLIFTNSNGVSFSNTNGSIWASVVPGISAINISGGTTSNNLSNLVFSNLNGVTFGLVGSTITASVATAAGGGGGTIGFFQNLSQPFATANVHPFSNVSRIDFMPFVLPTNLTIDYLRMLFSVTGQNFGISGTSSSTAFSVAQTHTLVNVLYSQGTGTDSSVLKSIFSASDVFIIMTSISQSSSNSKSISFFATYPTMGVSGTFSTSSSSGVGASYLMDSGNYQQLAGGLFIEPAFSTTLPPGIYWLAHGFSSSATRQAGGPNDWALMPMVYSLLGGQTVQTSNWPHRIGDLSNSSAFWFTGQGSYTTNAAISLVTQPALSKMSGFSQIPYFALVKS